MGNIDLATAVASRICHDLVSPVGAVVNGVDLLREIGGEDCADARRMIGQSAERASALLQFYRVALGAAGEDAQVIARGALFQMAAVLAHPPRITLDCDENGPPLARPEARLLSLLLMCGRSVTGLRGAIGLRTAAGAALPAAVTVEANSFSSTLEMLDMLKPGAAEEVASPRTVEFALAREAALALAIPLRVDRTAERVVIEAGVVG